MKNNCSSLSLRGRVVGIFLAVFIACTSVPVGAVSFPSPRAAGVPQNGPALSAKERAQKERRQRILKVAIVLAVVAAGAGFCIYTGRQCAKRNRCVAVEQEEPAARQGCEQKEQAAWDNLMKEAQCDRQQAEERQQARETRERAQREWEDYLRRQRERREREQRERERQWQGGWGGGYYRAGGGAGSSYGAGANNAQNAERDRARQAEREKEERNFERFFRECDAHGFGAGNAAGTPQERARAAAGATGRARARYMFGLGAGAHACDAKREYFKFSRKFHPDKYTDADGNKDNDFASWAFKHMNAGKESFGL